MPRKSTKQAPVLPPYENASRAVIRNAFKKSFGKVVYGVRPLAGRPRDTFTTWSVSLNIDASESEIRPFIQEAMNVLARHHYMNVLVTSIQKNRSQEWDVIFDSALQRI